MRVCIQSKSGSKIVDLSRRKAIRERCLNCCGWVVKEVKDCDYEGDCSLFPFRSGTGKQNAKERSKAIRRYCLQCCAGQRLEVTECPAEDCPLFAFRKTGIDRSVEIVAL